MGIAVYNAVPMVLNDGNMEHRFILKLNPSTDSFRLESDHIKRNVFIGRRMFNKLFQLIRNEYGTVMGRIQYSDHQMTKGSASTTDNEQFRFEIKDGKHMEVLIEDEHSPEHLVKVTLPDITQTTKEKQFQLGALIPSVLAALIFSKEARLIA